jgi:hypothetical protein
MNEQELRTLVRAAIAHHTGTGGVQPPGPAAVMAAAQHASHGLFVLPAGADTDSPCIIEPAVACNHCGYCKSLGH